MTPAERLRKYVDDCKCDSLERAQFAFRDCTPEQMRQRYGQSDDTRAEIIAGYERGRREWQEASDLLDRLLKTFAKSKKKSA